MEGNLHFCMLNCPHIAKIPNIGWCQFILFTGQPLWTRRGGKLLGQQQCKGILIHLERLFSKMLNFWDSEEARTVYNSLNPDHGEFGTHTRLLWAAAKASQGDVLEMGTGAFSTPMLHNLTSASAGRSLVSAETDSAWLSKFQEQDFGHHQLLLVPVYG